VTTRGAAAAIDSLRLPVGGRRKLLTALVLLACLGWAGFVLLLARTPQLPLPLAVGAQGTLVVASGSPLEGRVLRALGPEGAEPVPVDAALLHRAPRWQVDDGARARQQRQQATLAAALAEGTVVAVLDANGLREPLVLVAVPHGLAGLGLLGWPLSVLALVLLLTGTVYALAAEERRLSLVLLVLLVCLCQAGNLLLIAAASLRGPGLPGWLVAGGLPLHVLLDATSAAALLQLLAARRRGWIVAAWLAAALVAAGVLGGWLTPGWWWLQGLCLLLGVAAALALGSRPGEPPDPRRSVRRRLAWTGVATFALATAAVAATAARPALAHGVAAGASVAWYLFLASLLLLAPWLARSRRLLREFALLAGISTVATSLDLLFVAVFSFNAQASLAVAVFAALAVYAGLRQRILDHVLGARRLDAGRIFEALYRAARDVQARPAEHDERLAQLLDELFEPLERRRADAAPARAEVQAGGAELVVPVAGDDGSPGGCWVLRLAQRGQRLFEPDDARLAERVVDQLRRAVAYDRAVAQAVERGRHEERQRLAQDLHDDIGARLLTLMYQAPTPAIEDYLRHTLQDLKTLTRGLAASEQRLGDAAAEWKADLAQRLQAASAQLAWSMTADRDPVLTVVQWSALTRVLRELVSNALYHGHATRVAVTMSLEQGRFRLSVADDGEGRAPAAWSHGLGLGGVRKRVKQLGGRVEWRELSPRGIECELVVAAFGTAASAHRPG
jgi:signal transduction histidine kinase